MILAATLLLSAQTGGANPAPDRTDAIWSYADARVARQVDAWFQDGDFPRCVGLLRLQASYAPNDYEVATNLGWLLESMRKDDEALAAYEVYGRDNPNDPDAKLPVAMLYNSRRKYEEMVKTLEPVIAQEATKRPHPNVYRLLAKGYERLKMYDRAIAIWELQLKRFPNDLPAKANIARVRAKMKA